MLEYIINYESVKYNYYLRATLPENNLDRDLERGQDLKQKDIIYTWTPNFNEVSNQIFDEIYEVNKVALTYTIRWISAIPFALWDITVCTVARLAFYVLMTALEQDNSYVQFYHIRKNFEIAYGRLYGMLWNDKEGLKIVHRAALDKRFYTVKLNADTTFYDESSIPTDCQKVRDRFMCDFYAEAVWNRRNIKRNAFRNPDDEQVYDQLFKHRLIDLKSAINRDLGADLESDYIFNFHYERLEKIKNELIPKVNQENINPLKRKLNHNN